MSPTDPSVNDREVRNRLLQSMPADRRASLLERAELVELKVRDVMFDAGKPIEHVYFLERGVGSVLGIMTDGSAVETATVGYEGMVGLSVFHGVDRTAAQCICQVAGTAYRLRTEDFLSEIDRNNSELRSALGRYTEALFTMVAQASACNRMHSVSDRCARWLLMTHDRVGEDQFALTQAFLAQMLGVRRASVSEVASTLQADGLIEYSQGVITILDRARLEASACECYRIIAHEFARLLEGNSAESPLADVNISEHGESTAHAPEVDPENDPLTFRND